MELDGRVLAALAADTRFREVRRVAETGSTNRDLMAVAAGGGAEGVVLVTDFQSAGRGRLDRSWEARPGDGLLVSVLLRPQGLAPADWHLLTAAAALAARRACAEVAGVDAEIKWPNDLLAGGAKLAGILAESSPAGPGGPAVVVGMGLNVHGGPPGSAVLDDLAGRRTDRAQLLDRWLRHLDRLVGDPGAVAALYADECSTVGRDVSVHRPGGEVADGRAEGIDGSGRLLVRHRDGTLEALSAGDVQHLR